MRQLLMSCSAGHFSSRRLRLSASTNYSLLSRKRRRERRPFKRLALLIMLAARREERAPFRAAFLQHIRKIFLPHRAILLLVFHDRSLQRRREMVRAHFAAAEVARERHAVGENRNRLRGRKH